MKEKVGDLTDAYECGCDHDHLGKCEHECVRGHVNGRECGCGHRHGRESGCEYPPHP